MGFANIVSGGEKGEYVIKLDFGEGAKTARLAAIDESLADVAPKIVAAQTAYDAAKAKEKPAQEKEAAALDAYVQALQATQPGENVGQASQAVAAALQKYIAAHADLMAAIKTTAPLLSALNLAKEFKAAAQKQRDYWAGLQLTETRPAWCADYTEDATGEVATIEVQGEDKTILIAPSAPAWSGADGVVWAREIQRHDQLFWNAAVLPGWQKWKPTYRTGVITALYADDTADVKLDDAQSSAQGLSINQTSTLKAVPVQYMDCNADAFEVDDKVVIKFDGQSWDAPKVIGFVANPKPCNPWQLAVAVTNSTFNTASLRFSCKDGSLINDMVANAPTYTCDFSVGGSGWQPMTFYPVSALNPTIGDFKPGDKWSLPEIWFGEVESIGKCLGLDAQSNQYGGATMAFRVQKAGKTVVKFATKLDAALYSGTVAQYAGVGQARPPVPGSMPLEKFEFEFPD